MKFGEATQVMKQFVCAAALAMLAVYPVVGLAAQPPRFNYQAKLTDGGGLPLSGSHTIFFKLYHGGGAGSADAGSLVFSEQAVLTLSGGVGNHAVGTGTNQSPGPLTAAMLATNSDVFLQVSVDTVGNVVLPRTRLESVPYAIVADPGAHAHSTLDASDGTPAGAVAVDAAGNVGVGTASPGALLDVAGTARAADLRVVDGAVNSRIAVSDSADQTVITHDLGTLMIDQKQEFGGTQSFTGTVTQTFTPSVSGLLGKVDVQRDTTNQATIEILSGVDVLASGNLANNQGLVFQSFTLSNPVSLQAGTLYGIRLTALVGSCGWRKDSVNVYAGGTSTDGGDQVFRTYMQGTAVLSMGGVAGGTQYKLAGTTADTAPVIASRVVPAGQDAATDRAELILFMPNDNATDPDLITLRASNIRFQTYTGTGVQDIDNDGAATDRLTIDETGDVYIGNDFTINGQAYKPGGGSWASSSDASLKKNVSTISSALEKLLALRGVSFEWKDPKKFGNQDKPLMGMIADEVEKVFPEWIKYDKNGKRLLEIIGFEGLTVEAMKEMEHKLDAQKAENRKLRRQLDALEKRLEAMETRQIAE